MHSRTTRLEKHLPALINKYVRVAYGPTVWTYLKDHQSAFQYHDGVYLGLTESSTTHQDEFDTYFFAGSMEETPAGIDLFSITVSPHGLQSYSPSDNVLFPLYSHGQHPRFFHIEAIDLLIYEHTDIQHTSPMAILFHCTDNQLFTLRIQFPADGLQLCFDTKLIKKYLKQDGEYGKYLRTAASWGNISP